MFMHISNIYPTSMIYLDGCTSSCIYGREELSMTSHSRHSSLISWPRCVAAAGTPGRWGSTPRASPPGPRAPPPRRPRSGAPRPPRPARPTWLKAQATQLLDALSTCRCGREHPAARRPRRPLDRWLSAQRLPHPALPGRRTRGTEVELGPVVGTQRLRRKASWSQTALSPSSFRSKNLGRSH